MAAALLASSVRRRRRRAKVGYELAVAVRQDVLFVLESFPHLLGRLVAEAGARRFWPLSWRSVGVLVEVQRLLFLLVVALGGSHSGTELVGVRAPQIPLAMWRSGGRWRRGRRVQRA